MLTRVFRRKRTQIIIFDVMRFVNAPIDDDVILRNNKRAIGSSPCVLRVVVRQGKVLT